MRYIRKVTALILAIIFCVALVVGTGVIFSVKNVNVTYIDYSGEHETAFALSRQNLNKLKGTQLVFLGEDDIADKLDDASLIAVESYEKIYPCTVNIVLRERLECFYSVDGGNYAIYDDRGEFVRSEEIFGEHLNALDGCPDILIDADRSLIPDIAKLCGYFKENFGALRSLIESVTVHNGVDAAVIKLKSGMSIAVSAWREGGDIKMYKAHKSYLSMTDRQRTEELLVIG